MKLKEKIIYGYLEFLQHKIIQKPYMFQHFVMGLT
jgi:hypothetical protein